MQMDGYAEKVAAMHSSLKAVKGYLWDMEVIRIVGNGCEYCVFEKLAGFRGGYYKKVPNSLKITYTKPQRIKRKNLFRPRPEQEPVLQAPVKQVRPEDFGYKITML